MTPKEREIVAKRINSNARTLYNWEETKPELIKLIELGLEKEKELQSGDKVVHINKEMQEELKELIKEQKQLLKEFKEERSK